MWTCVLLIGRPIEHGVACFVRPCHRAAAREGRALGRAVAVDEHAPAAALEHAPDVRGREDIAACQQLADRIEQRQVVLDDVVEQARGQPERGHAVAAQGVAQFLRRKACRAAE